MSLWKRLFSSPGSSSDRRSPSPNIQLLVAPSWVPPDPDAERLSSFARRVARELTEAGMPASRSGGNHWVISYDIHEAVWYPAEHGSWAQRNGRVRDGWSQGECLLLFQDGTLAQGQWFGEVEPRGQIKIENVGVPRHPASRWGAGNLGRWRQGGGGLNSQAREHFKGFWPRPRSDLPDWAGTSAQLKRFLLERQSGTPRYY